MLFRSLLPGLVEKLGMSLGLAIIVAIYRSRRSASIDEPNLLKY